MIAIVGATGTGKSQVSDSLYVLARQLKGSQLAVALAQRFNGEIINCDALQMYEGLPIGTNQISVAERRSIPHHLLACIKPNGEPWTVTQFQAQAMQTAESIISRGKVPIAVGGTHYYIQSLLFKDALANAGPEILTTEAQEKRWPILGANAADMLAELQTIDPVMAQRWHPNDTRKIRRSLEIYLSSGRKASEVYEEQQKQREVDVKCGFADHKDANSHYEDDDPGVDHQAPSSLRYDTMILWTHASSEILRSRLDKRVDMMLLDGLLSEVESLYKLQCEQPSAELLASQNRGVWIAIGYKEFLPYLLAMKAGTTSPKALERLKLDCIEKTQIRTRQYAKSQIRWIRGKLLSALENENLSRRLLLLDATDISEWQDNVLAVADEATTAFLAGSALPESKDTFDLAVSMLRPLKQQEHRARYCKVCGKTMTTTEAWEIHLNSRKHKVTARSKQSKLQPDGELPPLRAIDVDGE